MNSCLNLSGDTNPFLEQETKNNQQISVDLVITNQESQKKRTEFNEAALYKSEAFFNLLSKNFRETVIRFDQEFQCIDINPSRYFNSSMAYQSFLEKINEELRIPEESIAYWNAMLVKVFHNRENQKFDFSFTFSNILRSINITLIPELADDGSVNSVLGIIHDITENKLAEDKVWDGEEGFHRLAVNSPDTIIVYDPINWKIIYFNRNDFWGYSNDKLESPDSVLDLIHPDDRTNFNEHWQWLLKDCLDEIYVIECRVKKKDNTYGWVQCREVVLTRTGNGLPSQILVNLTDITERKLAEQERLAHLRFFESMDRVNRAIQGNTNLAQMMRDVLDIVISIFDCDRAFLMYPCDPDATSWQVPMERNRSEYPGVNTLGVSIPMDKDIARTLCILLDAEGPVKFGPGTEYTLPTDVSERFGFKSFMSMALHPRVDKPWQFGIHQCSYPRVWTPDEERLFQEIGRRLSDGLTGLLAYRDLKESEERLRLTLDAAQIVAWEVNLVTGKHYEAGPVNKLFGRGEGFKHPSLDILSTSIHPDDQKWVMGEITKALHGECGYKVEYRTLLADGNIRWIAADGDLQYNLEGQPVRLLGIASDITERKQAEEGMRLQSAALEAAGNGIVITDREGIITWVNPAFIQLTGYMVEEIVGQNSRILKSDKQDVSFYNNLWDTILSGKVWHNELINRHKDGHLYVEEMTIAPVRHNQGEISAFVAIKQDVSERKQHELEHEVIISVGNAMGSATTRAELVNVFLNQLMYLFDADGAMLALLNDFNNELVFEMGCGAVGERFTGLHIPPGKGVSRQVITNGKPYLNNTTHTDPLFFRADLLGDSSVTACVPLISQDPIIGVIWIARKHKIMDKDLNLLIAIANLASVAIHRVTLHEQTEQQLHHLAALHQIDIAINADFDLNNILNVLLNNSITQLVVDAASVLLLAPSTQSLEYAAGIGFKTHNIERSRVQLGEGRAGKAAVERRIISLPDLDQTHDTFSRTTLITGEQFVSHIVAPLIAKGQIKGVLEVFHHKRFDPAPEWFSFFEALATQAAIAIDQVNLFNELKQTNIGLVHAYDATIEGWSYALDLRDKETEGHTKRVTEMTLRLAQALGMSETELVNIRRGSLLHDIGKLGIPDNILFKPGSLTNEEWEIMRKHPVYAYEMLSKINYLQFALDIPHYHHEKWDGSGYPCGLEGEHIPLSVRIFMVVDVWDALRSDRPYRQAWEETEVIKHIQAQTGLHFDPDVVNTFLRIQPWKAFKSNG